MGVLGCFSQETFTKTLLSKNRVALFGKLEEFILKKKVARMLGKSVCVIKRGEL